MLLPLLLLLLHALRLTQRNLFQWKKRRRGRWESFRHTTGMTQLVVVAGRSRLQIREARREKWLRLSLGGVIAS